MPKHSKQALTPPDLNQCQAEKPGNGPFTIGGKIGDPKNGYRVRCESEPKYIATEKRGSKPGSMSLCAECKDAMVKQLGEDFAEFSPIGSVQEVLNAIGDELENRIKRRLDHVAVHNAVGVTDTKVNIDALGVTVTAGYSSHMNLGQLHTLHLKFRKAIAAEFKPFLDAGGKMPNISIVLVR